MHRAPRLRSRSTLLYLVPLTALLALGLVFGRTFVTASSSPSTRLASVSLAPAASLGRVYAPHAKPKTLARHGLRHRRSHRHHHPRPITRPITKPITRPTPKPTGPGTPAPTGTPTSPVTATPTGSTPTTAPTSSAPTTAPTTTATATATAAPTTAAPTTTAPTTAPTTTAPPTATPTPSGSTGEPAGDAALENAVIQFTNVERAKAGCGPVQRNDALSLAGRRHAQFEADNQAEGHLFPGELDLGPRFTAAGYVGWTSIGENAAGGAGGTWFVDARSVMYGGQFVKVVNGVTTTFTSQGWMQDAPHKANILNCAYKDIGVGAVRDAQGAVWWSQEFGTKG